MAWTLTLDETGGIGCNVKLPIPRPIPLRFTRATEVDQDVPSCGSLNPVMPCTISTYGLIALVRVRGAYGADIGEGRLVGCLAAAAHLS